VTASKPSSIRFRLESDIARVETASIRSGGPAQTRTGDLYRVNVAL
jgi:hypothetical protein